MSSQWRIMQNLKRNELVSSKLTWGILTWALKNLKNLCFNGLLLTKVYNVWAKTSNEEYLMTLKIDANLRKTDFCFQQWHEEWWKIWTGIDLSAQNWHEEFNEFWPDHSKISKICILMGCFWEKHIISELKRYRGVMSGGSENWCKIW